mgnify:CR=1 FL=1
MKYIKYILTLIIVLTTIKAEAQQDTRYSQYMFNGLRLNPAYAGTKDGLELNAFYRNQWVRIDDAPKSIILSAHKPFGKKEKVGLGAYLEYDVAGVDSRTSLYVAYSYKFDLGEDGDKGYLAAGLQGGLIFYQAQLTSVITPEDGFDNAFSENESYTLPNFGAGLFYYTKDQDHYAGFSIPHLIGYEKFGTETEISRLKGSYREYLFTAGTTYDINENIAFKPSLLIKYIPAQPPVEFDLNASVLIRETVWLGATLRSNEVIKPESINIQIAYQGPKGMRIGYSYDHMITDIAYYTSGAHEFMIGCELGKKTKPENVKYKY